MSDAILTLLRLGFLALVWFFFARVASSVWQAVPSVAATATVTKDRRTRRPKKKSAKKPSVVIVEPLSHAGLVFEVDGQLTIGRSAACDITLDDTFVSSQHARVAITPNGLLVSDLGSTNGTYVDRQKVTGPVSVHSGSRVQVGSTVMEVR
ncbi:MAG: FHA domain-containing protein [Acidimicrobiales bacterium]|nr:FHA domain-containing protein [Acidimicrobiales bacterium]